MSSKDKNKILLEMPRKIKFEDPIRDEIFSPERLEQYALFLASELSISFTKKRGKSLLPRFEDNYKCFIKTYRVLTLSAQKGCVISPAGEWFVDNFHIIEEQVREVRVDLPEAYYRELPKVLVGKISDYPQVYAIALAIVAHQDSHVDIETIKKFLRRYQTISPLLVGEIWAVAIALRLALIENLRRLADQILYFHEIQKWADDCADQILLRVKDSDDKIEEIKNELIKELQKTDALDCFIIVQLSKRFREQSSKVIAISECLDNHLLTQNLTFDQVLHTEYQRQSATQLTVSNIVNSMRLLSNTDWEDFFESVNIIDPILNDDPAGAYKYMDFKSRDRYRHVIEKIQKKTGFSERDIALETLHLANEAFVSKTEDTRKYHVGFYLIDEGLGILEEKTGYQKDFYEAFIEKVLKNPTLFYFSSLTVIMATILSTLIVYTFYYDMSLVNLLVVFVVSLIPVSDCSLGLLNHFVTRLIKPRVLAKIDLSKIFHEIPNAFVVVPTIIPNKLWASKMLDGLEVRYLSNQDKNLYFALLTDFVDSRTETSPADGELIAFIVDGIEVLNQKYSKIEKKFFLFHRKRLWNSCESKWIGWERKRGKIHEFNRFLRGAKDTSFIIAPIFEKFFANINYVITLDSDTHLPRGSANFLLGTIIHPLNKAQFDTKLCRVVKGYSILQPRISITPESSEKSWFSKIFSGHTGIDPYTTAVSDVYQDLFGEGIYTGKGIYDVDFFERSLALRVPENTILSHDLFEGLFARTALVTEVEFLDDYPVNYDSYVKRQQRWVRGDWQIYPWLFSVVTSFDKKNVRNNLPFISRWKIFDNLRRSLVPIAVLLWLVFGWTILTGPIGVWSLITLVVLALPYCVHPIINLFYFPKSNSYLSHLWNILGDLKTNSIQFFLILVCLPHQAFMNCDAVLKALYRVNVSKKNLLLWQTSADVDSQMISQNKMSVEIILIPIFFSFFLYIIFFHYYSNSILVSLPFVCGWLLFPVLIKNISQERKKRKLKLDGFELNQYRNIARKTWNFFERFIAEGDNWFAPDNYQEDPKPLLAHRTSPTNIGLQLLATCSANNFGYLDSFNMLLNISRTLESMLKLETCFGHFYNWYDTQTMLPLEPKYISTVDSGNLAGHLIAVKQSCLSLIDKPLISSVQLQGLSDTLLIVEEKTRGIDKHLLVTNLIKKDFINSKIHKCIDLCQIDERVDLLYCKMTLIEIQKNLDALCSTFDILININGEADYKESMFWLANCISMSNTYLKHIDEFTLVFDIKILNDVSIVLERSDSNLLARWQGLIGSFLSINTIREHNIICDNILKLTDFFQELGIEEEIVMRIRITIVKANSVSIKIFERVKEISLLIDRLIDDMDFKILFDSSRKLFSIGYNVEHGALDNSFYDLLASESRLASYMAIAKGDVPQSHWFHLGRQMTSVYNKRVLISWSASMFEYLMPCLVMKTYPNTLLNETQNSVIEQQKNYSKLLHIPWGISESAYNARDLQMNYQYGPFGVPGLGLKRGLGKDVVVSPYSTALAAIISTKDVFNNFKRLINEKTLTDFGFYESIDYTKNRINPGHNQVIIRSFMVHHQGMILTSLDNVINNNVLQNRFHDDLLVRSSELLLQEQTPKRVNLSQPRIEESSDIKINLTDSHPVSRHIKDVDTSFPSTQVLSNSRYSVILNAKGSGYSKCEKIFLTRWNEDQVKDNFGTYIFIEDDSSKHLWSSSYAPLKIDSSAYKTSFSDHKADFWCNKFNLTSHTEVIVSSEDNVEMRRITLINHSVKDRTLNITSYLEPIITSMLADISHPQFSNLFIETEYVYSRNALLAHRRKRSLDDVDQWAIHFITFPIENLKDVEYETNRRNFIGRSNDISKPAMHMSNNVGAILDPILSLKKQVRIAPHETIRLCFVSGLANSRDEALRLIDSYYDQHIFEREEALGWNQSQAELRHLNIGNHEAKLFQRIGTSLIYPCCQMRFISKKQSLLNIKPQSALWNFGISGDVPILLVVIKTKHEIQVVRDLLHAHEYFRYKVISFDLVILNSEISSYRLELQDEIFRQVRMAGQQSFLNKSAGIFVFKKESLTLEDFALICKVARVYFSAENGSLKEQVERIDINEVSLISDNEVGYQEEVDLARGPRRIIPLEVPKLILENGYGGFLESGREYVIKLESHESTPAPWCNVISNEKDFGFFVSESGSSNTWSKNSRENRITPWSNDPVSDPSGESLYIVDLESNEKWSPTPNFLKGPSTYLISHGQGYTKFENNNFEIRQKLLMFCSIENELKINRLSLKNESFYKRKFSIIYFVELVLGTQRTDSCQHIVTKFEKEKNVIFAQNPYSEDFGKRVTFFSTNEEIASYDCDRRNFLNHNSQYGGCLDRNVGAGFDPCVAIEIRIELNPGEERELSFILGQADSEEEVYPILSNVFYKNQIQIEYDNVLKFWDEVLNVIQIKSSVLEFDILVNRWLLYQNLSCRIWARTAFYQSGGAFGFRDQLQDVLALLHTKPSLARKHILLAASCQFIEGDVLHWWHPPANKGVRTRFSDDLLWLAYCVANYVKVVGDYSIIYEEVSFVEGPNLSPGQDDFYFQAKISSFSLSLYEHCVKAIDKSLMLGPHGLPLMGGGDWNDGMNKVGIEGRGESVWVAWFLISTLNSFLVICEKKSDLERINIYKEHICKLKKSLETHGWDGSWYKRAFFDDSTSLGSTSNDECKIDSLSQSWAAISKVAHTEHLKVAMDSLTKYLVKEEEKLILLFTPAFDKTLLDPGYIKGYLPGVRENGGQYTHAAIWAAIGFAAINDGNQTFNLLKLLNPINHTKTKLDCDVYKVEPYVISADVYSNPACLGQGGWSWYTGSAGWYYRAITESLFGIYIEADRLIINPCLPDHIANYEIKYKYKTSVYHIHIERIDFKNSLESKAKDCGNSSFVSEVILVDDGKIHRLEIKVK